MTTFKSWEEVGSWWSALATPEAAVTPASQAKADELTKGLSSDTEKARAIYQYVAMKFPQGGKYTWLDTTAEVAPFRHLIQVIRDEHALVIPANGKAILVHTPLDPPGTDAQSVEVKAALDQEGTLTGHFDFQMTGDLALGMRVAFRQLAPSQWRHWRNRFRTGWAMRAT